MSKNKYKGPSSFMEKDKYEKKIQHSDIGRKQSLITSRFIYKEGESVDKLNKVDKTIICANHDFEYVQNHFKRVIVFLYEHRIVRDDIYEAVIEDIEFLKRHNNN